MNDASPKTIELYSFILKEISEFLKGKQFRETTEQDVFSFLAYKKERGLTSGSLQTYKIVIKNFYRVLYDLPKREYPSQVKNLNCSSNHKRKIPIRPENVLTKEDIAKLVKYCRNFRDEAILVTLYESGCRLGEFIRINVDHLKFDERGIALIVEGKTGERRIRLIESVPYLQKWLENHPRKKEENAPLWCSIIAPHKRITDRSMYWFLRGLKKRSGFKKPLNPHAFRHSRITELARYLPDAKLKVFAGWTGSSTMTAVYVHLSGGDLDDDLLKLAGVEVEQKPQVSPLLKLECPRCGTKNPVNNTFCGLCGLILDEKKAVVQELDQGKLESEIEDLKEKYETAGEITDQLWETIDAMKKEIEELKR